MGKNKQGGGDKKRNKKQFYKQQFQQSKRHEEIKQGITGFLVTCETTKEQRCVKELFNILNDWVEKLYPELDIAGIVEKARAEQAAAKAIKDAQIAALKEEQRIAKGEPAQAVEEVVEAPVEEQPAVAEEQQPKQRNVDDEIQQEIAQMRKSRIFFTFETGTNGVIFIKLLDELRPYIDVNRLGLVIVKHIAETKDAHTRFTCRFIPIDILCKAKIEDFRSFAYPILAKYFTLQKQSAEGASEEQKELDASKYTTWCMEFKNKNNNLLKKQEVLDFIFKTVDGRMNPVDLKNADLYVIVEVYRDLLMVGVVPNYKELKKYNLQSLIRGDKAEDSDEEKPRKVIKLSELIGKRERGELDEDFKKPGAGEASESEEEESESENEQEKQVIKESSSDEEEVRLI